jgi:hypothetical protein
MTATLPDVVAEKKQAEQGSVASVEPGGAGRGWLRKLGGCVDLELSVPRSSGRRSRGSGSRRR